jgi:hypothetical protein
MYEKNEYEFKIENEDEEVKEKYVKVLPRCHMSSVLLIVMLFMTITSYNLLAK